MVNTPEPNTREAWDRIAHGYDRTNTSTQMSLGTQGLRRVGLRAGMRFLDVAAGSGALSIPAARLGANVLATDQSPVMLELLTARARREGLTIETRVMDGHALTLLHVIRELPPPEAPCPRRIRGRRRRPSTHRRCAR